ncbi:UDP-glucose/GDP-mannose dehydrogenase family protein [candidate division WOR-3 bacterium]|nr:UDP-glucose/GDP-mannose dehydrogenase family protein [candidate division WOR-3 bacterium]
MKIAIIGSGYVGVVTAAGFAEFGNDVIAVDKDAKRVKLLSKGKIPFYEPELEELVNRNINGGRLKFTTDLAEAVRDALVVFICVGTPEGENGEADTSAVKEVAQSIAGQLHNYKVIVTKSTVPVGTGAEIQGIMQSVVGPGVQFSVCSNPEFLREGAAVHDFLNPDRIVIGVEDEQAREILEELYRPLKVRDVPLVVTDLKTAELIKYVANAFLAMKISFVNEVANVCDLIGADVHVLARALGLDGRISPKFLHPGPGYGGSCFPKDTVALREIARHLGYDFKLVATTVEVNQRQKEIAVDKVVMALGGDVSDKIIGLLGLSFKPYTDDIRESPAIYIASRLIEMRGIIQAYDPSAMANAAKVLKERVTFCKSAYEAAQGADVLVVAVEWPEFRNLELAKIKNQLHKPVIIDLKNIYEPSRIKKLGFRYIGMGRR